MISFTCPACRQHQTANDGLVGTQMQCLKCGHTVIVPGAEKSGFLSGDLSEGSQEVQGTQTVSSRIGENERIAPPKPIKSVGTVTQADLGQALTELVPPPAADELGKLGNYRLVKVLGQGGMGVVYQAEDLHLKRTVAVKAMLPCVASSARDRKRFLREAQAMAAVEHDHIVRIYQVSEDRGIPFLAMELLKGEPLNQRLQREPVLPLAEAVRIARETAEGLAAAHANGLIHRDIKPANIWLESRGEGSGITDEGSPIPAPGPSSAGPRVKILDFGLARAGSEDLGLTTQGAIIGTPAYMAPEQAAGSMVDPRCDLFSLGVILYQLVTGGRPFQRTDTVATLLAVTTHHPLPPKEVNPCVPGLLSDLVMQLLEKDPDRRVPSAAQAAQLLQRLEQGNQLTERQTPKERGPSVQETIQGGPKLTRWLLPAVCGLAIVVLGATFVIFFLANSASGPNRPQTSKGDLNQTTNGTLLLLVEPADASEVQVFLNDTPLATGSFRDNKPKQLKLEEGRHTLKITSFGYEPYSQDLTIKAAAPEVVSVKLKPVDSSVAEWFKARGFNNIDLTPDGKIFHIVAAKATDECLEHVRELRQLRSLLLSDSEITDAGLKHLHRLTSLLEIHLTGAAIGDDGIGHLKGNSELLELHLRGTGISNKGIEHLKHFSKLRVLRLDDTAITDAALKHLGNLPSLRQLGLNNTKVTNACIEHLLTLVELRNVSLGGTKVTKEAIQHFKAQRPKCAVYGAKGEKL